MKSDETGRDAAASARSIAGDIYVRGHAEPRLVVTLSSIPPRFDDLCPTLQSLIDQNEPADEIVLYIPHTYRRFPEWDGQLPAVPAGVSIRRVAVDYGPATKVLPAIREFSGQDVDIIFCDDDRNFDPGWIKRFRELRLSKPGICLAEAGKDLSDLNVLARDSARLPRIRIRKKNWKDRVKSALRVRNRRTSLFLSSGYCDVFLGTRGVLVRPEFFTDAVFDIPDVLWTVDDYWLSGHLETNGVPIWVNARAPFNEEREIARVSSLRRMIYHGHGRKEANNACIRYCRENYGIWLPHTPSFGNTSHISTTHRSAAWEPVTDNSRPTLPMGEFMTPDEARRIAEDYARSVPDDIHVPTLATMIEKHGIAVLNDKETMASASVKSENNRRIIRS